MVGKGGLPKLPVSIAKPKLALPKLPTIEVDTNSSSTSATSTIAKRAPTITTATLEPVTKAEPVTPAAEVADEVVSVRDQAIDALRGAGFFDRPIIGRSPEELSDEDLNESLAELARRSFVSEATGADIRDVKDVDFGNLLNTTQQAVVEDVLGVPLDALTPVGRSLVDSELRDTTGTSSQMFNEMLDDLAGGTNNAGFIRPTDGWSGGAAGGATLVGGGTTATTTEDSDGGTDQGSSGGDGDSGGTGGTGGLDIGFDPTGGFGTTERGSTTGGGGGSTGGGSGGTDTSDSDAGGSSSGGSADSGSPASGGGSSGSGSSEGNGDEQRHVVVVETAEGSTTYTYYERDDGSMYVVGSDGTSREASSEEVEVWGSGDDDDDDDEDSSSGDGVDSEPSAGFTPSEDGVDFGDPFRLLPQRQIVFEDDGATDPADDGGGGGAVDSGYLRPVPDVSQPVDQDTRYVDLRNLTFSPPDDGVTDPVDSMASFSAIDATASAAFAAFDAPTFASRSFEGDFDDADAAAATDDDGPSFAIPDLG